MPEDENGKREMGWMTATLDGIVDRLGRIEKKLDSMSDWKSSVDARLATGSEKFRQLEGRDRQAGWIGSVVGILAAIISAVLVKIGR